VLSYRNGHAKNESSKENVVPTFSLKSLQKPILIGYHKKDKFAILSTKNTKKSTSLVTRWEKMKCDEYAADEGNVS